MYEQRHLRIILYQRSILINLSSFPARQRGREGRVPGVRDREGCDGGRPHPVRRRHRAARPQRAHPRLAGEGRAAQHPRQVGQVHAPLRDRFVKHPLTHKI